MLVVEDEVLVGMPIEEMLQEPGHEPMALSTHLDEALSLAHTAAFDFALLDINLDGKQSFPVADVIRRGACPSCSPPATAAASSAAPTPTRRCCKNRSASRSCGACWTAPGFDHGLPDRQPAGGIIVPSGSDAQWS